jgi:zinc/manganese transport system substrate-binding protein
MRTLSTLLILLFALSTWGFASTQDQDPIRVVATIPDLGDIIREVGGDLVDVTVIAKGTENVHSVRVKPSHLVAVSRADVLFEVGLSLEHGWVPGLIEVARNPDLRTSTGRITVSNGMTPIEVPVSASRQNAADVHPQGNPHVNLSHEAGRHFADGVRDALIQLRPESKKDIEARHKDYVDRCLAAEKRWAKLREALEGKEVVVYHREFSYLLQSLGIKTLVAIEPKPGVPPTPRHLAKVVQQAKEAGGVPVLTAPWSNFRSVSRVAEKTDGTVVQLPSMVGALEDGGTWIGMMDEAHRRIAKAFDVPFEESKPVEPTPAKAVAASSRR